MTCSLRMTLHCSEYIYEFTPLLLFVAYHPPPPNFHSCKISSLVFAGMFITTANIFIKKKIHLLFLRINHVVHVTFFIVAIVHLHFEFQLNARKIEFSRF